MTYGIATITIKKKAGIKYSSIIKLRKYKRSSIKVAERKGSVNFRIAADDATALRASANAVLRELQVIEGIEKVKLKKGVVA